MADIKTLIRKRGIVKAKITVFHNYVTELQGRLDVPSSKLTDSEYLSLEMKINSSTPLLNEFEKWHDEIELIVEEVELPEQLKEREKTFNTYFDTLAIAKSLLDSHKNSVDICEKNDAAPKSVSVGSYADTGPNNNNNHSLQESHSQISLKSVKLPMISLPKFDGGYGSWLEFRDIFKSLIHENTELVDIQKFHYLKACLEGNSAHVIQSLKLSAANYEVAWQTLVDRYDNTNLLIQNHIKSLHNIEAIQRESSSKLRNLVDNVTKNLRSLKLLDEPVEFCDTLLIFLVTSRLDANTEQEWEKSKPNNVKATLNELLGFLNRRADILETIEFNRVGKAKSYPKTTQYKSFAVTTSQCQICKAEHFLYNCDEFKALSNAESLEKAKQLKVCINCLKSGHFNKSCKYGSCKLCNSKHNTLLHVDKQKNEPPIEVPSRATLCTTNHTCKQILLSTALIQVLDALGEYQTCRVVLDSASQSSFITESFCSQIGAIKSKINMNILGINQASSRATYKCNIKFRSCYNTYESTLSCIVLPRITNDIPDSKINKFTLSIPKNIQLADPNFNKPGPVDILVGAELFWHLICRDQICVGRNKPIFQQTRLGWIVSGPACIQSTSNQILCNFSKNVDIQNQLATFWEIENSPGHNKLSLQQKDCEAHFVNTVQRSHEGRFIVSLPLKDPIENLGDSSKGALKRFYSLERKFERNPQLKKEYCEFMSEYIRLGHMSAVTNARDRTISYYLPHHAVLKRDSVTTKLRVVFDGSAPSDSGWSLNDLQHVGPTIQQDLLTIVLRFRQHTYVVSADISKMYRQVLINENQRHLQQIYWREDSSQALKTYSLNTVTYGTTAAPFLAIRCLQQLAFEHRDLYPTASEIIARDFYVDDMITGAESVRELSQSCEEVSKVLKFGCFELRKWVSNEPKVLSGIQQSILLSNMVELGEAVNTKTLGLFWSCDTDELHYKINYNNKVNRETKRTMLSTIAQIHDPLGLLAPCIMIAKIMLQKLWLEKLDWDDNIPKKIATDWNNFKTKLPTLSEVRIPRHAICKQPNSVQIHGFCDASQEAYGACVYLRSTDYSQVVHINLICAKGKVAPLSQISIPRLELCGAVLLAQLITRVKESLTINLEKTYLWTDSTIVLGWIATQSHLLKPFVSHRIAEIQENTKVEYWHHISTRDNPADLISRGTSPQHLKTSQLWWSGPSWLHQMESQWPISSSENVTTQIELPELRSTLSCVTIQNDFPLQNYSKLTHLQRIVAWCFRFKTNCTRTKNERLSGPLTLQELKESLVCLIKLVQGASFAKELSHLKQNTLLSSKSKLLNTNPFLDDQGIIRVGGRIENSKLSYDKKHPILLPNNNHLTKLIFEHEHLRLLHAGPQQMLFSIRQRFWPIHGKNMSKKIFHNCIKCFRQRANTITPIMGNLPTDRVTPESVFHVVGVDYAGPMLIKNMIGKSNKRSKCYVCLFVCFAVKAVHIELVSNLSSEAFLASFRRFIARRGKPRRVYSDNGTTFIGANSALKELGKFLIKNKAELIDQIAREEVEWHFIPPRSSHFGGIWEAGIKSMKTHLKRIAGMAALTFEELNTLLTQIESILNSRPLSSLSSDPNDLMPLTPAHFLIGRSLVDIPSRDLQEIAETRLSRFQRLQKLKQHFWKRSSLEYLSELQTRNKWQRQQAQIKVGTLVLVKEDNAPPLNWNLGRVIQTHPGTDGVTRVVSVKTIKGVVKRALAKICPLPSGEQEVP